MNNSLSIEAFKLRVEKSINYTDSKSDTYRIVFYTIRLGFILITGAITVLSGWQDISSKPSVLNWVLLLGAFITALTSCDTLFQIETKKNVYKLMKVELKEIRNELSIISYDPENLQRQINEVLYPKYLSIMAYSKVFIERGDDNK